MGNAVGKARRCMPHIVSQLEKWARLHDWGTDAEAFYDPAIGWQIGGLISRYTWADGTVSEERTTLPADLETLMEWAGY